MRFITKYAYWLLAIAVPGCAVGVLLGIAVSHPTVHARSSNLPLAARSGTAPLVFTGNRIYAELTFVHPDGTFQKSLAFVDLGSPSTILSPGLFRELALNQKRALTFQVGKLTVTVDSSAVTSDSWLPFPISDGRKVEAVLPAGVMRKYQVVIDYAKRTLTLAQPGTLQPEGVPVPFQLKEKTGLVAVDATIDGKSYPITIDSGSAYTWVSKARVREWLGRHPDWERGTGAVGVSNMRMADDGIEAAGTLVRIPEIRLGSLRLANMAALAIGPDNAGHDFIDWYSKKNPVPVIGWLGGNALRGFRVTLDYPRHVSYWLRQTMLDSHDLDQVGLTLMFRGGEYFVAAVATQHGKPTVEGVQVGDKLLQIDGVQTRGAARSTIFAAMHGKPGDVRTLVLERHGKRLTVQARVTRF